MNKTVLTGLATSLILGGCQTMTLDSSSAADEHKAPKAKAPEYSKVQLNQDYLVKVAPGYLKTALASVAAQANLQLVYEAEDFLHKHNASLSGSPTQIAQTLSAGFPVRVYQAGNGLVVEQVWTLRPGSKLKQQLMHWDTQSDWTLVYETNWNQHVQATSQFYGTFDAAIEQVFKSVRNDGSNLEPEFYPNNTVVIR